MVQASVPCAQPLGVLIMEALAHQYASMNRGQPVDGIPPSPDPYACARRALLGQLCVYLREASEFNFQNLNWKEFERKVMAQRRSSMPVAPGSINLAQRLQPVYPFEPYNLRHSQHFITEIYREWSDVSEVDDSTVESAVLGMVPAGALGLPKEKAAEELLTFMWKDPVSSDADDDAASGASDDSEISLAGEIDHGEESGCIWDLEHLFVGGYSSSATDEEITYNPHARVATPGLRKAGFANTLHAPTNTV